MKGLVLLLSAMLVHAFGMKMDFLRLRRDRIFRPAAPVPKENAKMTITIKCDGVTFPSTNTNTIEFEVADTDTVESLKPKLREEGIGASLFYFAIVEKENTIFEKKTTLSDTTMLRVYDGSVITMMRKS